MYSSKWIFSRITASIKDEQIIMKFINIQINKYWPKHALLIIHGYIYFKTNGSENRTASEQ